MELRERQSTWVPSQPHHLEKLKGAHVFLDSSKEADGAHCSEVRGLSLGPQAGHLWYGFFLKHYITCFKDMESKIGLWQM